MATKNITLDELIAENVRELEASEAAALACTSDELVLIDAALTAWEIAPLSIETSPPPMATWPRLFGRPT